MINRVKSISIFAKYSYHAKSNRTTFLIYNFHFYSIMCCSNSPLEEETEVVVGLGWLVDESSEVEVV